LAVVITHGTESNFYEGIPGWLAKGSAQNGFAALTVNRRDHDQYFTTSRFALGLADIGAACGYMG
jgi:hypothetical protein